jgi:hypothetical protein
MMLYSDKNILYVYDVPTNKYDHPSLGYPFKILMIWLLLAIALKNVKIWYLLWVSS